MFSATKLLVAAAIVALFGGLLLAGLLMTPSEEPDPAAEPMASPQTEPSPLRTVTFRAAGSLAEARGSHTATLLPDGRVLVVGGYRESDSQTEYRLEEVALAEAWDPTTETFGPAGTLADGHVGHTATLLPDGRVLVIGGVHDDDGIGLPSEAVAWDPKTGSFSPAGSTAVGRSRHTATLLPDGRVLVVGGDGGHGGLASAEVWDPETESFSATGSLAEPRSHHTATLLPDGRVLVVGGLKQPAPFDENVGLAEIWDTATETFAAAGTLERSRQGHVAALLRDGRVLIAGGQYIHTDPDGGGENRMVATAEVWDPATMTFSHEGTLAGGGGDTATVLADGRVLIVGGCCDAKYQALASAEIWDPRLGSFVPAGSLAQARIGHTVTLTADGRVLVVGGWSDTAPYVHASAEIWEPGDDPAPGAAASPSATAEETAAPSPHWFEIKMTGYTVGGPPAASHRLAGRERWRRLGRDHPPVLDGPRGRRGHGRLGARRRGRVRGPLGHPRAGRVR